MTWLTRRRIWALATAAFVAGLVEFMPAYWFEARINQSLPQPWRLSVGGTIWNGYGWLQASDAFTVPLKWQFDPLSLIRLRATWKLVADAPTLSGSVKIGATLSDTFSHLSSMTSLIGYCPEISPAEARLLSLAGFRGIMPKTVQSEELVRIVMAVIFGGIYLHESYSEHHALQYPTETD